MPQIENHLPDELRRWVVCPKVKMKSKSWVVIK